MTTETAPSGAGYRAPWPVALADRFLSLVSPEAAFRRASELGERGEIVKAFPLFVRAAKAGITEAEYRVARCYLQGTGVPPSRMEGARWLMRAADRGHVDAQSQLAALFVHGLAGPVSDADDEKSGELFANEAPAKPDFASAARWARKAADADSASGQAMLAFVLTWGPDSIRDLDEAHRLYEKAAKADCPEGCLGYALSLAKRATGDDEKSEAAKYMRRAADSGLTTAIYLLATLTEQGFGVPRDPAAAMQLYRKAAERGLREAQFRWGRALIDGRHVEPNSIEGESWLRKAALAGDVEAAAMVGDLNIKSKKPPNYLEAANWYRRAAEAGHKNAAHALGSLYLTGAGVAEDKDEAARWLRISAEAGNPASQIDLANLLLKGAGSTTDAVNVSHWFEEAAKSGDLVAAFNYGICLANGMGVDRDEQQAAQWLERAADGVPNAQYMFGRMLAEGRGVAPDLTAARAWYRKAADAGMPDAQVALAEMMLNGRGGAEDAVQARELFEKAAAEGHGGAMYALGALYGGDPHFETNLEEAQRWLREAAERGHGHAQLMLGRYLAAGTAGTRDPVEARMWLERAYAQGIDEAQDDLDALPRDETALV